MRAPCIVILGLGQGVGLACAHRFVDAKWSVVIVDANHEVLNRAEKDMGDSCVYLHEDQFTRLGLKNALAGTLEQCDGVDFVLSIPPIPEAGELNEMTAEALTTLYRKSSVSSLLAAQTFSKEMIREIAEEGEQVERLPNGKGFLHILSRAALAGDPDHIAASLSQGALLSVMKSLALEFAPHSIRSNALVAVRPRSEKTEPWLKHRTPLGRSARPSEIAEAAFFLTAPESRFITGQTIEIDGGRSVLNGIYKYDELLK